MECDASVMRGDGACGIIGAVSGQSLFSQIPVGV